MINEATPLPDVSCMQRHALGYVRYRAIGIIAVSLYVVLWGVALALFGLVWWPFALFAFVPLLVVHRLSDRGRMLDPETWIKGWRGESSVKKLLRELEPLGYRIVNHLDIGHGDVDHVVMGPSGVFAIETKNHAGHFTRSGSSLTKNGYPADDILAQAIREAATVRERTGVRWVEAVVVVPTGSLEGARLSFAKATVVDNDGLLPYIMSRGKQLDPTGVERIANLLGRTR